MTLSALRLETALDRIAVDIRKASSSFEFHENIGDYWALNNAEWHLKAAYSKLLVLAEVLGLPQLRAEIADTFRRASTDFFETDEDPDGGTHLKWSGPARTFHEAINSIYSIDTKEGIAKDLELIVRNSVYSITDKKIYGEMPNDEDEVHVRIEGILKCVFPDLKHKPALSKPIKNFQPDTGIPSIGTVIEYKFVREKSKVSRVSDEILADTRGYTSPHWKSFLYVIYETQRFRTESDWRDHLRDCGVSENTSVIVLCGTDSRRKRPRRAGKKKMPT